MPGYESPGFSNEDQFDDALRTAVQRFQAANGHRAPDGLVGPGTRVLITQLLLLRFGPSIFLRLQDPDQDICPKVFISYSSSDAPFVNQLEEWLQGQSIRVIRYTGSFEAGRMIMDEARSRIAIADKVVVVHSTASASSDWVGAEVALAEELERRLEASVLIYLCLDDTPLPRRDPNRIAILGTGRQVMAVRSDLLRAIAG